MNAIEKFLCCYFVFCNFSLVFTKVGFKATITTWNVNEKSPVSNIANLVQFTDNPDFYAFTLQEVNSNANPLSKNDEKWVDAIKGVMTGRNYELIKWKSIDGSFTAVFSKSALKSEITNIDTSSERLGQLGVWGNKGGTAVRFDYRGSSIVFVGAHFHAHDSEVGARIADYNNINKGVSFKKGNAKYIKDHDVVFWSGDLNFRIDDLTADQINEIVESKSPETVFTDFMAKDQLRKAMKEGRVFQDYVEDKPKFRPTYKYTIGSSQYNLERKPAYTDRVLYRLKAGNGRFISYTANTDFTISDHKPVTASIAIE